MKFPVFLSLVVAFSLPKFGQAQSMKKLYYSKQWQITTHDSAFYYRVCALDTLNYQFIGEVNDYLINDQLVMKGSYSNGQKNGEFISYHPNGQIESQGLFKNGIRFGTWKYYFLNGKIWREVKFSEDNFFVISLYEKSGELKIENGTGEWVYEYEWPGLAFNLIVNGFYNEGKKQGEWRCSSSNGDILYIETYKNDKFKSGVWFENGVKKEQSEEFKNKFLIPYKFEVTEKFFYLNSVKRQDYPFLRFLPSVHPMNSHTYGRISSDSTSVFSVVEEQADFPGGLAAFYQMVAKNIRYPKEARNAGIEGKVFVEFIINIDGRLSDVKTIKGIGGGCDEEAERVVSLSPAWTPGKQKGKAVRTRFVIPIAFRQ